MEKSFVAVSAAMIEMEKYGSRSFIEWITRSIGTGEFLYVGQAEGEGVETIQGMEGMGREIMTYYESEKRP